MKKLLLCVMICVMGFAVKSSAQGNTISITLLQQTYNCQTGELFLGFQLKNKDMSGNTSGYSTAYTVYVGNQRVDQFSWSGDEDVYMTVQYIPGDFVIIRAQGAFNNNAPSTEFSFEPNFNHLPEKPVITGPAMPVCSGTTVTLSAGGSSGNYVWSDGRTGDNISVSAAGSYRVRSTNDCGTSDWSDPFDVSILAVPPAPVIGSSGGVILCNGSQTQFTATSTGGTINWSNGATGTSILTGAAGNYYATETNACGTSGNSNVVVITTKNSAAPPVVASSNGTTLCNGQTTVLSTAPTAGGYIVWNTGETGNSITVSAPGTYMAYESNDCGTSNWSNAVTITAGSVPSAPTVSSSNGTFLCNGSSTVLAASGSGSITWSTGAAGSNLSVSSGGTYYAVASNACGTSSPSNSITISTASTPAAPVVSNSSGTLLCNGASTTLSASPSYGGTIRWNTGASGNSLVVSSAGSYYAYEANGCGNGPAGNTITISTLNTPAAPSVTPSGNQLLCNGASVTLTSSGVSPLWSNGAVGNSLTTSVAGAYYTIDRNACGNSAQSNTVNVTTVVCPTPLPGSSFFVCPGALKILDAGAGYDTYLWSNGAATRTIAVGPGTYTVTVSKEGCYATSAAVTVGYYSVTTPTVSASGATTFCAGGSVTLSSSTGAAYNWNTGANASAINVTASGSYYVTVTDANGCQATSTATNVTVNPLPSAAISGNASVCQNGSALVVTFTGSGATPPYTFSYRVNGGGVQTVSTSGGGSVSVAVPTNAAGSFTYSLVSVQESSSTACSNTASGSVTVNVNALPVASVVGNTTVCKNIANPSITFSATGGNAPYTFAYRINGGVTQVVTSSSGNSAVIAVPTSSTGTFVYSLVSVQEAGGCLNTASGNATVTVNPVPDATITGGASVCQNANMPVVTFTGSGGVAPYAFSYKINGGAVQTVSTVSGNSVTVAVPTNTAGDFTYTLIGVQESSATACSNTAAGSVLTTVRALPTATIAGTTTLCRNSASPVITFTANGGTAPYTFSYRINGGLLQTITTVAGNTASVSVPTAAAGVFTYTLESVQESSTNSCVNAVSASSVVTINPLPTATISGNNTVCQNATEPQVIFNGATGTAPYTFSYRINGGAVQMVTSTDATASVNVPTTAPGTFTYTLVSVQDASSTACTNAASGSVVVVVNPVPVKAIVTTANTHLCNGEVGVLKVTNYVAGYSYTWYKDGAVFRTTNKDTIQVTVAGTYTVLAVSDKGCAAASVSDQLIITTGSVVTPVITGYLKVCKDGKTMLAATNSAYEKWRWTGPPDRGKLLSEDSGFFAGAGQYRVRVMNEGCADSSQATVTADDTEFPAGELKQDRQAIAYGETVRFDAEVTGAATYKWDLGNGKVLNNAGVVVRETYFLSGDSIPVKLWATSKRNCTTLFTTSVRVAAMVPNTITNKSFTGKIKDWNVFPIPFRDELKITAILKRSESVRVELFTADGKWVKTWTYAGVKGENLFTVSDAGTLTPNVLYFIVAYYNGEKHTDKIYKY